MQASYLQIWVCFCFQIIYISDPMKSKIQPLFLFITSLIFAQTTIPVNEFINPLKIPIVLAGTYGELRSNHFHSGVDIKTLNRTGQPVLATASGSISRIKVERYGYGKALYLEHSNGYTSVYAHLEKFSPKIENYVKAKQYEKESYTIELFPKEEELAFKQGEIIAYSGNTGGSSAPHLHYEIRDKNSRPMNPMLFGLDIADTRQPVISDLFVYPLGEDGEVNQSQNRQKLRFNKQPDGTFLAEKIQAYGDIGFGIATIDQQNDANNKNGIYKIETSFNGEKNLEVLMDKFSFAETRYLNRMIDYEYFETNRRRVQKLFIERNNPLSIYKDAKEKGILRLTGDGYSYVYNINVFDFKGNRTSLLVPITVKKDTILQPRNSKITNHFVQADQSKNLELGKYAVYIPKNAFYDDYYLDIYVKDNVLHLDEDLIPVHKYITISYDVSQYKPEDREKLYIGSVGYGDNVYYTGSYLRGDKLTARTRTLNDYTIAMDNTPPSIKPDILEDGKWMTNYDELKFTIEDNESGLKSYRATVNGKFILMEYEYKNDTITHHFDDGVITETKNDFKLIVTDNVGNSSTFTATFYRK